MKKKFRLTMALTPELYCTDITASLPFYTQILGFNIQYQREEEGFAMLERQGSRIMLDQIVPGSVRNGPLPLWKLPSAVGSICKFKPIILTTYIPMFRTPGHISFCP